MRTTNNQKIALVTGGGSGMGRSTALLLAARGAAVIVADMNAANAAKVAAEIEAAGGTATAVTCNVADQGSVRATMAMIADRYGRLDYAANNAGITGPIGPLVDFDLAAARNIIDVNLMGVMVCMQEELKLMLPRGTGSIVNTCSIWGLVAGAQYAAYTASKHAVAGLTKAVALETAQQGVRVNAICPGFTETPMITDQGLKLKRGTEGYEQAANAHPIGRMGQAEDMANAIAWLLSDEAAFVTGTCLSVDGGFTAR
jgi:NAD(P)-dependent dehydrogenase (short-subunit alcohol dehydrogenase family)